MLIVLCKGQPTSFYQERVWSEHRFVFGGQGWHYGVGGVRNYGNVAGRSRGRGRGDRCDSQRDAGQSKLRKQESLKYRNIGQF